MSVNLTALSRVQKSLQTGECLGASDHDVIEVFGKLAYQAQSATTGLKATRPSSAFEVLHILFPETGYWVRFEDGQYRCCIMREIEARRITHYGFSKDDISAAIMLAVVAALAWPHVKV